jgi:uncharacterized protein (TIGR03083 family)
MDYLTTLRSDYRRLAEVSAPVLAAKVPTCPEWTVNDLVSHVAHVYLHKVECMRHNAAPDPWPPGGTQEGSQLELLHRGFAELMAEFEARPAQAPAYTWYEPERTVGFWLRRMAQETVIHRIDAELAAGVESLPVPDDLALDGIDEVLVIFLAWASEKWPEDFTEVLGEAASGSVGVASGGRRWRVSWEPSGLVRVVQDGVAAQAEISGTPEAVLRWVWRRSSGQIEVTGDGAAVESLRRLMQAATQ